VIVGRINYSASNGAHKDVQRKSDKRKARKRKADKRTGAGRSPSPLLLVSALVIGLISVCGLTGCTGGKSSGNRAVNLAAGGKNAGITLRIGHQRADALNLLKVRGDLDRRLAAQGVKVEWANFPAGPPLLEALGVGSLDLGSTGESPPLFAQASGSSLVYLANIPLPEDPGKGQAILVKSDSPIHTVADLKGRRVAFSKASGAHNLVLQALEQAGLKYTDIQPIFLAPPDARAAFESGSIDAWAIWEPYLTVAEQKTQARVLVDAGKIVTPGGFYLASRAFAKEHPEILKIALEEIDRVGVWANAHPNDAAQILSQNSGVEASTLLLLQNKRARKGIRSIDDEIIKQQQTVADNYVRIGLLPKPIDVREAMLTPAEYAALTPAFTKSAAKAGP